MFEVFFKKTCRLKTCNFIKNSREVYEIFKNTFFIECLRSLLLHLQWLLLYFRHLFRILVMTYKYFLSNWCSIFPECWKRHQKRADEIIHHKSSPPPKSFQSSTLAGPFPVPLKMLLGKPWIHQLLEINVISDRLISELLFCRDSMRWFLNRQCLKMLLFKKDQCNQFYTFYILIKTKSFFWD